VPDHALHPQLPPGVSIPGFGFGHKVFSVVHGFSRRLSLTLSFCVSHQHPQREVAGICRRHFHDCCLVVRQQHEVTVFIPSHYQLAIT
jgi:hypothetical protein